MSSYAITGSDDVFRKDCYCGWADQCQCVSYHHAWHDLWICRREWVVNQITLSSLVIPPITARIWEMVEVREGAGEALELHPESAPTHPLDADIPRALTALPFMLMRREIGALRMMTEQGARRSWVVNGVTHREVNKQSSDYLCARWSSARIPGDSTGKVTWKSTSPSLYLGFRKRLGVRGPMWSADAEPERMRRIIVRKRKAACGPQ